MNLVLDFNDESKVNRGWCHDLNFIFKSSILNTIWYGDNKNYKCSTIFSTVKNEILYCIKIMHYNTTQYDTPNISLVVCWSLTFNFTRYTISNFLYYYYNYLNDSYVSIL